VVSEIVAVAIDVQVQKALGLNQLNALRHVDDWYIGFNGAGDAEGATSALAVACREFEIELNTEKTKTLNPSTRIEAVWPSEIRRFHFPPGKSSQSKALEHFFALVFQQQQITLMKMCLILRLRERAAFRSTRRIGDCMKPFF
jgi:hypothetical protein